MRCYERCFMLWFVHAPSRNDKCVWLPQCPNDRLFLPSLIPQACTRTRRPPYTSGSLVISRSLHVAPRVSGFLRRCSVYAFTSAFAPALPLELCSCKLYLDIGTWVSLVNLPSRQQRISTRNRSCFPNLVPAPKDRLHSVRYSAPRVCAIMKALGRSSKTEVCSQLRPGKGCTPNLTPKSSIDSNVIPGVLQVHTPTDWMGIYWLISIPETLSHYTFHICSAVEAFHRRAGTRHD